MMDDLQIGFSLQSLTVAAGAEVGLPFRGDYVRNFNQVGTGPLMLSLDGGPFSEFKEGAFYRLPPGRFFKDLRFRNDGGASLTAEIGVSLGKFGYDSLVVSGGISVKGGCSDFDGNPVSVGVSATQILAENTSRTSGHVRAGSADLYIASANTVTTANGYLVPSGGVVNIGHTAAVWGVRAAGSADAHGYEETA